MFAPVTALCAEADLGFAQEAKPLLEKFCVECHGPDHAELGLNFATFGDRASILSRRDTWRKVREVLEAGTMPPPDGKGDGKAATLGDAERQKLLAWVRDRALTIDRTHPSYLEPGTTVVRQLTRTEYNNTIRDLLGFGFDAAGAAGIPHQEVEEGYINLAGGQQMDDVLFDKYLRAADAALKALFEEPQRKSNLKTLLVAQPSDTLAPRDAARQVLERFTRRAYRRPTTPEEIDRLLVIVDKALAAGDAYELAVRKAMKPVLVSPHFLYRLERDQAPAGSREAYRVSDHELAVRLSYFLWASMPDEALFKAADAGELAKPELLQSHITRMLADNKAAALTDQFAFQWLQLQRLRRALPSRNNFPAFTGDLKQAMEQETRTFFDKLRAENRSILELLDADYTYVNDVLAQHYGIPDVKGREMRRVVLRPEDHRGGLAGMASVLTLTSHTDRTKPTARGKWVLDVVLGTPPTPPPANVSNFKPQPKNKPEPKSFRDRLALHASDASCAACHAKIDPLGFALENYDAIGGWREKQGDAAVDNAGRLPGGQEFSGPAGLKQILKAKQEQFVRNLNVQLLTYALGRHWEYTDELAVVEISEKLARDDYRFATWVRGVVESRPFQYRQNLSVKP